MFCIHQDSEVDSLAEIAEEVGNVIILAPFSTVWVFIARSKTFKIAFHRNTLNTSSRRTSRLKTGA